jgi:hypothetical protein
MGSVDGWSKTAYYTNSVKWPLCTESYRHDGHTLRITKLPFGANWHHYFHRYSPIFDSIRFAWRPLAQLSSTAAPIVALSQVLPPRIPPTLIASSHNVTDHPLPPSLFTVDDTRGVMMQLKCRRLDYAMWCWLLLVPTEQMGRNQSNLQSDRDSLIDLDCEIKGWSIRIELTISEDRINNQPETVSTNNKLFSSIDKKEPHLMF